VTHGHEISHISYASHYMPSNLVTHRYLICDGSQRALNIRPAPGKSVFTVGPYEWCMYDCNFVDDSSHSYNLSSHSLNTKVCAIEALFEEALKVCLMCCLHLTRVCPACHFSHCNASKNWFCDALRTQLKEGQQTCSVESSDLLES